MLQYLPSCLGLVCLLAAKSCLATRAPTVNTTSGIVKGFVDPNYPAISQYRSIPFAEPPVGSLRFAAPVAKTWQSSIIDATSYGPQCLQLGSGNQTATTLQDNPGLFVSAAAYANSAEDCLSLALWTPTSAIISKSALPVIIWFFGGGFTGGGTNSAYYNGAPWVQRSQEHIVVTFNYRTNIMGTPNALGLAALGQNLNFGLLDQRLVVEWVHNNIAAFGGDPSSITIWGQSAGSISVDYYQFAYPDDSLITGFIAESGNALYEAQDNVAVGVDFTFVAETLGCTSVVPATQLACMRALSFETIKGYIQSGSVNSELSYYPIVDNLTVFPIATYPARILTGDFSKKPVIMGTTAREGYAIIDWNYTTTPPADMVAEADAATAAFYCAALAEVSLRYSSGVVSYEYVYDGNFSDISTLPWMGAFHASDAPMFFGTYGIDPEPITAFQRNVSHWMQDVVLAFMKDPINGPISFGWPQTTPTGPILQIGAGPANYIEVSKTAALAECATLGLFQTIL